MSCETRVLYNAECPVCSTEINHYARYSAREGLAVRFEDLNTSDLSDWRLSRDDAARRLYILRDGELLSGIPAFLALWRTMPRYRWLAKLVGLPGIRSLAVLIYDRLLAPLIYRWHRRRRMARVRS